MGEPVIDGRNRYEVLQAIKSLDLANGYLVARLGQMAAASGELQKRAVPPSKAQVEETALVLAAQRSIREAVAELMKLGG